MKNHVARNGLGYLAIVAFGVALYCRHTVTNDPDHTIAWRHLTLSMIYFTGHWIKMILHDCTKLVIRAVLIGTGHEEIKNGRRGP